MININFTSKRNYNFFLILIATTHVLVSAALTSYVAANPLLFSKLDIIDSCKWNSNTVRRYTFQFYHMTILNSEAIYFIFIFQTDWIM